MRQILCCNDTSNDRTEHTPPPGTNLTLRTADRVYHCSKHKTNRIRESFSHSSLTLSLSLNRFYTYEFVWPAAKLHGWGNVYLLIVLVFTLTRILGEWTARAPGMKPSTASSANYGINVVDMCLGSLLLLSGRKTFVRLCWRVDKFWDKYYVCFFIIYSLSKKNMIPKRNIFLFVRCSACCLPPPLSPHSFLFRVCCAAWAFDGILPL